MKLWRCFRVKLWRCLRSASLSGPDPCTATSSPGRAALMSRPLTIVRLTENGELLHQNFPMEWYEALTAPRRFLSPGPGANVANCRPPRYQMWRLVLPAIPGASPAHRRL
eukprot:7138718-Pyramimonas_sp.AAC.1